MKRASHSRRILMCLRTHQVPKISRFPCQQSFGCLVGRLVCEQTVALYEFNIAHYKREKKFKNRSQIWCFENLLPLMSKCLVTFQRTHMFVVYNMYISLTKEKKKCFFFSLKFGWFSKNPKSFFSL